jgi:hypothetical protein
VIGVTVVEARGAKTGVPAAATPETEQAAAMRAKVLPVFIVRKNSEGIIVGNEC